MKNAEVVHNSPRIGVFDSGVGGVSILQAIQDAIPNADYYYCSDSANYPYGTKTEDFIISCAKQMTQVFVAMHDLDLLVIACNTASTIALPALREMFGIPVVGVVPAIKPAAIVSKSKVIGLLATPGTISRAYTDQLIKEFAADCQVVRLGTRELVDMAELKIQGKQIDTSKLSDIVGELFKADATSSMDTVVLGCTHFPLLIEELNQVIPRPVTWVDSGKAIANRVEVLLKDCLKTEVAPTKPCSLVFTRIDSKTKEQAEGLKKFRMLHNESLSLKFI